MVKPLGRGAWTMLSDENEKKLNFTSIGGTNTLPVDIKSTGTTPINMINAHADKWHVEMHVTAVSAAAQAYMLIDLSGTTKYPHTLTSRIVVDSLEYTFNSDAAFVDTLQIGYLGGVNTTNGDLRIIKQFDLAASQNRDGQIKYTDDGIRCDDTYFLGLQSADLAAFNSGTTLKCPDNTGIASGNGDLVAYIPTTPGNMDFSLLIGYHTE